MSAPIQETLAAKLEDFRKRHWMHWSDSSDNAMVCEAIAALSPAVGAQPLPARPERAGAGALAMRVLQSDLYHQLDDLERAQCDALISGHLATIATPPAPSEPAQPVPAVRVGQSFKPEVLRFHTLSSLCHACDDGVCTLRQAALDALAAHRPARDLVAWRVWNGKWVYFDEQPHWTLGPVYALYGASTTEAQA